MPHLHELYGSSFLDLYPRILGEDDLGESKLDRFVDALLESEYVFDDSCQGHFPEEYLPPEGFVFFGGHDRRDGGEVDSWLGDGETSGDIHIDIVALQLRVAPLGENCDEEVDFPAGYPAGGPFRIAELGVG